jgi:cytochrome c2
MTRASGRHVGGVVTAALCLIGSFALLGSYFNQLSGAASYDVTRWRGSGQGEAKVSAFVGQGIFLAPRFACAACHKIGQEGVGIRGPNLGVMLPAVAEPIAVRAAKAQRGKTAVQHIVQALYEPDAYVAAGFDARIMPAVNKPPLMLTHDEIRSVILFLFQRSGVAPTAALTEEILHAQRTYMTDAPTAVAAAVARPAHEPRVRGDARAGAQHFASLHCDGCHRPGGSATAASELGRAGDGDQIFLAVADHPSLDAGAVATRGLTVAQLRDLVAFLQSVAKPKDAGAP